MRKKIYIPLIVAAVVCAAAFLLYLPGTKNYFSSIVSTDTDGNAEDAAFSDVDSSNPFYDAVNFVQSQGIVNGYEDDTYKPDNSINRAEFIKILIDATSTKDQISGCVPNKNFSDVSSDDWFSPYICEALNSGIVGGYSDNTFKPGNSINFTEASKIIVNAFGYETSTEEVWYQPFVEKLEEFNAIPSSVCSVSKNISRGELAEMIYRLREDITDKSSMSFFSKDAETIESTTFLKSYRLKDNADSFDIVQTSDGGYAITGSSWTPNELCGTSMFWIKANGNGDKEWSKMFHNCSSDGYAITQLTDGNYVVAGEVSGEFRTDEEQLELEGQGDNLVIKVDNGGNQIWSRTVSQQSTDIPAQLLPAKDGGFVMSGSTGTLTGQADVADVMHAMSFGNFSADGETNWFKRIEGDTMIAKPASAGQTSDGGYIIIGTIKLIEENDQRVPALVKLDKNGEFQWATGLENLPIEIPNLTMNPDGKTLNVGIPNKMHLAFGQFTKAAQADDDGYIALGNYFSAISTAEINEGVKNAYGQSSFVGVKVDSKGKLEWARTIKVKKYLEDPAIEKTLDGGYVIMGNSTAIDFEDQNLSERNKTYDELMNEYNKKYPPGSPETPESKRDMEIIADTIAETESPFNARHIILIKLDKNFNYQWGKDIGGTRDLDGYAITPTTDSGYAIGGTWHTGIKHKLLGTWLEITDAMILKLDANGNLGNDNGLVTDLSNTSSSDVSVYVVANDLSSPELVVEYPMENVVRSITVSNKDSVNTTTSEATTYETRICGITTTDGFTGDNPPPTTKTRAQMKYDETIAIEPTTEKGALVNDELMPILNEIYKNEVKLWDDDIAGWVAYRFNRLVTEDDINETITTLETLGYGIDKNDNKDFTATKIGLTLNFHFYLGDTNTGRLDVMY